MPVICRDVSDRSVDVFHCPQVVLRMLPRAAGTRALTEALIVVSHMTPPKAPLFRVWV